MSRSNGRRPPPPVWPPRVGDGDESSPAAFEFDAEKHAEWCAKWAPPCPDGNPRQVRHALGFRERSTCELELRVPLGGDDLGVCQVVLDERDTEVYVRVLVCLDPDGELRRRASEYINCPVRSWLDQPLGERAVIDVDTDEELPLYQPADLNRDPDAKSTYVRVRRRRSRRQQR